MRGLEVLEDGVERRREISGGRRSFILVPGIDVPFHSSVLRVGVADFRRSLERVMPRDQNPDTDHRQVHPQPGAAPVHVGPRLHPGIRDRCLPSRSTRSSPTTTPGATRSRAELCRKVVIELLAWQFASPVRWIETQDLLFIEEAAGGLGIERLSRSV